MVLRPNPPHPTPSNKTFSSFQKGRFTLVFLKPREPFPIPIKWKEYSIGPLGSPRADSLRGLKHFRVSRKGGYELLELESGKPVSRVIYFYGPYRGLLRILLSGDKAVDFDTPIPHQAPATLVPNKMSFTQLPKV